MSWEVAKDTALMALAGILTSYIGKQLHDLVMSVQSLNIRIAEILGEIKNHRDKIEEHSKRLQNLEGKY